MLESGMLKLTEGGIRIHQRRNPQDQSVWIDLDSVLHKRKFFILMQRRCLTVYGTPLR
jgi:hypothetical protein